MFVAFERKLSYAYVKLHKKATREIVAQFLENLTEKVPFTIQIVRTVQLATFSSISSWPIEVFNLLRFFLDALSCWSFMIMVFTPKPRIIYGINS